MSRRLALFNKWAAVFAGFAGNLLVETAGAGLVEFTLVAPLLLATIFPTIDFGFAFFHVMQVQNVAQVGAQYASVNGFSASSISAAVTGASPWAGVSASPAPTSTYGCATTTGVSPRANTSTPCPDGSVPGTYVTVFAMGTYNTIVRYPSIPNSFVLSSQSMVRIR